MSGATGNPGVVGYSQRKQRPRQMAEPPDYEQAKALARHPDAAVRANLVRRGDLSPELLYYLADDEAPEVRRAVVVQPALPVQAPPRLARDGDGEVRTLLAAKLARALPGLQGEELLALRDVAHHALELLAADQLVRVRAALSSTLAEIDCAPPQLVARLARDTAREVAEPVLRTCALLSDEELIGILAARPEPWVIQAIARRPTVASTVSEAVLAADDADATAMLLGNEGADIPAAALGSLIDRSGSLTTLQPHLAKRPGLPPRLLVSLAEMAEENVLRTLERRHDLDEQTAQAVAAVLKRRLEWAQASYEGSGGKPTGAGPSEEQVWDALSWGDHGFVRKALARLARLPAGTVAHILETQSPRAVTALAWRAGLSMRCARQLQVKGAGIHPRQALNARMGTEYPLSEAEMRWQLEFFGIED